MSDRIATILEKLIDRIIRERNEVIAENEKLRDEIERLQEERRWIPVSERLPEVKGRYICSIMYKEEPKKIWVEQRYWDGYGWDMYTSIVTHWMPLPEPPESEG
jgi:hypothetical protein